VDLETENITAKQFFFTVGVLIYMSVLRQKLDHLWIPLYMVWPTQNFEGPF
jgi:hypothetical protein